tara:strand:+ start:395 stop:1393 length:999 start_codon:yes stop_codon:yes gene_type:complete
MILTPIKLLENEATRSKLLKVKRETTVIDMDDYLESRMQTEDRARDLMAIEDGSEMAKHYLHAGGVFERIIEDIKKETGKNITFSCRKTRNNVNLPIKKGTEYMMMEWTPGNGTDFGHYAMARVEHGEQSVSIYDSMANQGSAFEDYFKTAYTNKYTVLTLNKIGKPQPTGGDVTKDLTTFKKKYRNELKKYKPSTIKKMFEISQYDELSQHHFCYVESFISLMVDLGFTKPGYRDPRERIVYIKRVVWGLIHKYVPASARKGPQWNYFVTHFPYIMTTRTQKNETLKMKDGEFQVPPTGGVVKYGVKKLRFRGDIDQTWSLKKIIVWARPK